MTHASVLIVDDEKNILSTLSRALRVEDYDVDVAGNAEIALRKVGSKAYDLLLLDVQLPDQDGLSILRQLREQQNDVPVIMMSGHGTIETAVQATQLGAYTFLEKPIGSERLLLAIQNCLGYARLAAENEELKERAGATDELLGESPVMQALRERIALAANANANVLVTGERGTGKELVARAIHLGSKRAGGPYEKLNCAAVPAELIESELFGHERGAFTGAVSTRKGAFEEAHGGTIFLDEIGELPTDLQPKLLRVLEQRTIRRVGSTQRIPVDVRVVAATNRDLRAEVNDGHFRSDLYYRLAVIRVTLPPLRARGDDFEVLVPTILERLGAGPEEIERFTAKPFLRRLRYGSWPGNIRELRNYLERCLVLDTEMPLHADFAAKEEQPLAVVDASIPYQDARKRAIADFERRYLEALLEQHDQISSAAEAAGLHRVYVHRLLRRHGIKRGD